MLIRDLHLLPPFLPSFFSFFFINHLSEINRISFFFFFINHLKETNRIGMFQQFVPVSVKAVHEQGRIQLGAFLWNETQGKLSEWFDF